MNDRIAAAFAAFRFGTDAAPTGSGARRCGGVSGDICRSRGDRGGGGGGKGVRGYEKSGGELLMLLQMLLC